MLFCREHYMHTSFRLAATHIMRSVMTCIPFYFTDDCKQNENERKIEIKRSAMLHLRSKRTPRTPSTISKALVTGMVYVR